MCRFRESARQFHLRESRTEHHWSGIRANRLSSDHGEFCKLFCSRTSRELDFFSESGTRSGEQLLNMIDMCTAFSSGKDRDCSVFRSLFEVNPEKQEDLKSALDTVRKAAIGASWNMGVHSVRVLRNRLLHDFLTLDTLYFEALVACAKQLLYGIRSAVSCISGEYRCDYADKALAEIEGYAGIVNRDFQREAPSDDERRNLNLLLPQATLPHTMLKNDESYYNTEPVCLKKDIQEQLKSSVYACTHLHNAFNLYMHQAIKSQ